jgi:hypothetical protein
MSGPGERSLPRRGVGSLLLALAVLVLAGPSFGAAPIDINSASRAQLKTLQGIGDAEAQRIIARRPYRTKAELVTANVLPAGIYQSIRHRIIAVQPGTPRPGIHP